LKGVSGEVSRVCHKPEEGIEIAKLKKANPAAFPSISCPVEKYLVSITCCGIPGVVDPVDRVFATDLFSRVHRVEGCTNQG
jgi:hypothetical protein